MNNVARTGAVALAVPIVLANLAAVYGQAGWAWTHLIDEQLRTQHGWAAVSLSIVFAMAIESIGIYLSTMAHLALMADQSAGLLRLGSYSIGVLAGALNYWHFASPGFAPNAVAVTFAVFSAISPWLWSVYSRYLNRVRLTELGMVDKRLVKLSTARKILHPVKSWRVVRWAAWSGVTEPDAAVAGWERATGRRPAVAVAAVPAVVPLAPAPFGPPRPPQGADGATSLPSWRAAPTWPPANGHRIELPSPDRRTRPASAPTSGAGANASRPEEKHLARARELLSTQYQRDRVAAEVAAPGVSRNNVKAAFSCGAPLADALLWVWRNESLRTDEPSEVSA